MLLYKILDIDTVTKIQQCCFESHDTLTKKT